MKLRRKLPGRGARTLLPVGSRLTTEAGLFRHCPELFFPLKSSLPRSCHVRKSFDEPGGSQWRSGHRRALLISVVTRCLQLREGENNSVIHRTASDMLRIMRSCREKVTCRIIVPHGYVPTARVYRRQYRVADDHGYHFHPRSSKRPARQLPSSCCCPGVQLRINAIIAPTMNF